MPSVSQWVGVALATLVLLVCSMVAVEVTVYTMASDARDSAKATCLARNSTIPQANNRWDDVRKFLLSAAELRTAQAKIDPPALAQIDYAKAAEWRAAASDITPYPLANC